MARENEMYQSLSVPPSLGYNKTNNKVQGEVGDRVGR